MSRFTTLCLAVTAVILTALLLACGASTADVEPAVGVTPPATGTATAEPPTGTAESPTATAEPPAATAESPTATPKPSTATGGDLQAIALRWSREGGLFGYCDALIITAGGQATASSCKDSTLEAQGAQPLPPDEVAQLQSWLEQYESFEWVESDPPDTPDALTTRLVFNGRGATQPDESEQAAIAGFAERVFTRLSQPTAAACTLTAQQEVTVYQRPGEESAVFGTLAAGDAQQMTQQTADGWLGFQPGVAQAANVGVFRLRWIAPDAPVTLSGDCAALPLAPVVSPTACYFMAMSDTAVYAQPQETADVVATIPREGYAAVTGQNAGGWYQLDLQEGTLQQDATAWLAPADGNFNGPCEALPTVTP